MAKATHMIKTTFEVTLTLSGEEAESLQMVFHRVGGSPSGRRGHIDSIARALRDLGYKFPNNDKDNCHGTINFED